MAQIKWSEPALEDLNEIAEYIASFAIEGRKYMNGKIISEKTDDEFLI